MFLVLIYLDAGHGGKDAGAVGNGLKEKDLTLDICKRIQAGLLNYEDVRVLMSRESDIYLTLDERTRKANVANADVLLSVHINSASASARGFETFIHPDTRAATKAFQNTLHPEIFKAMNVNVPDRGKKAKNFHMVRESKMSAVLTENLFISNASDAALLGKADFRQKIAQGHITGLEKFLGLKKNERKPPPPPIKNNKLWIVQVGAFEDKANAEALQKQLLKDGYRPFIKQE
jgi:N-acetylmuramoyl-L-alanine amidase